MPFYRVSTPICGTQDLPCHFKDWKACLVEIWQTAHKIETNAYANFPIAENFAYQCMENGWRNMPTLIFLYLAVAFRYDIKTSSSTYIDRPLENVLKVVSDMFVARSPSKSTTN